VNEPENNQSQNNAPLNNINFEEVVNFVQEISESVIHLIRNNDVPRTFDLVPKALYLMSKSFFLLRREDEEKMKSYEQKLKKIKEKFSIIKRYYEIMSEIEDSANKNSIGKIKSGTVILKKI
jgi:hypothetical protein